MLRKPIDVSSKCCGMESPHTKANNKSVWFFRPGAVVKPAVKPNLEGSISLSERISTVDHTGVLECERIDLIIRIPSHICELSLRCPSACVKNHGARLTIRSKYCNSTDDSSRLNGLMSTSRGWTAQGRPNSAEISLPGIEHGNNRVWLFISYLSYVKIHLAG